MRPVEYAVFLRGVNVAGITVRMAPLRDCLADLGLERIATYQQSGNATFTSGEPPRVLRPMIEEALTSTFSYAAHVLLYPMAELRTIVDGCPFPVTDGFHRYVVLCDSVGIANELIEAAAPSAEGAGSDPVVRERVAPGERAVYWLCPRGSTLSTPFARIIGRRKYRAVTTNRNLNTVEKMVRPDPAA